MCYEKRMRRFLLSAIVIGVGAVSISPSFSCPSRVSVAYGDTLSSIARSCGVNVEALVRLNPGLTAGTLYAGSVINVPRPAVPSPQQRIGRPTVQVMPPLVPPAVGAPSIGGVPSTVILPPDVPPVPLQHILRGFGDQPGQLPLPPGHIGTMPGNMFPHQRY